MSTFYSNVKVSSQKHLEWKQNVSQIYLLNLEANFEIKFEIDWIFKKKL